MLGALRSLVHTSPSHPSFLGTHAVTLQLADSAGWLRQAYCKIVTDLSRGQLWAAPHDACVDSRVTGVANTDTCNRAVRTSTQSTHTTDDVDLKPLVNGRYRQSR